VRALAGADLRCSAGGLAAFGGPVLLVFAWLAPIVSETLSRNPGPVERARALRSYANDLVIHSQTIYHLAPSVVARTGAIAVGALLAVPLAALAGRSRWTALVLGGTVLVLAPELWSPVFTHFSDLVSLSQSRRAAGFVPFAFAFAGGLAVLARGLRLLVLPVALASGIVFQLEFPGDFGMRTQHTGPAFAAWVALFGGLAGVLVAVVLARRGHGCFERTDWLAGFAALLFVLPVVVHGFAHWDRGPQRDGNALTPGLVQYLRTRVPERAVVFADLETSYRISAYAPVYVAVAPPTHVANTRANRPDERRKAWLTFLRTGDLAIPRSFHAGWLVLKGREHVGAGARLVYRDGRFRVYRL